MEPRFLLLILLVASLVDRAICSTGVDLVRQERTKGAAVVQQVVDIIREQCIYNTDRQFLRRLALVQSSDGLDPKTYRFDYSGGIWQIDEQKYNATQNCTGEEVSLVCHTIRNNLNIDWLNTTWSDLRKPLYSGLAAALYTIINHPKPIPPGITEQANFWKFLFAPGKDASIFVDSVNNLNITCDRAIDLVFIIDSSGSIDYSDFRRMLKFMTKIVSSLPIGSDQTRVGVVRFSSFADIQFNLNDYFDSQSLETAISAIQYDAGGTNTPAGLRLAREVAFSSSRGARDDSVKVALLITDGQSYDTAGTGREAQKLRGIGVNMFAIGVGLVNYEELNIVATPPNCTHLYLINDFNETDTILHEIQKDTCRAQLVSKVNSSKPVEIKFIRDASPVVIFHTDVSEPTTLVTEAQCGVINVFASFETSHPGSAFYQYSGIALDNHPFVLMVSNTSGRPLYVNYEASKLLTERCMDKNSSIRVLPPIIGKHPGSEIICRKDGKEKNCSTLDFQLSGMIEKICPDNFKNIPNPCDANSNMEEASNLFHKHPLDATKFIRCDFKGRMYITQCPDGEEYHHESFACGTENLVKHGGTDKSNLAGNLPNPCTQDGVLVGTHFYAHPKDKTKFIECDLSGNAWVLDCPEHQIWQQEGQTCIVDYAYHPVISTQRPSTVSNPCTSTAHAQGIDTFPHPDATKFIRCDNGIMYVMDCPAHLHFVEADRVCGGTSIIG